MKKVGLVGLGDMGIGMAQNIVKNGFELTGFDLREERLQMLSQLGGKPAASCREVAENSDAVFVMVLNGLFPVFALILLGYLLKRTGLTSDTFLNTSDKLVYYIFFPALLFWKIGGTQVGVIEVGNLAVAALSAGVIAFLAGALVIRLANIGPYQAGTFSQGCYRFNTYVGMAVAMTAIGDIGVRVISILIGFMIPLSNMLAVTTLIWYSGR